MQKALIICDGSNFPVGAFELVNHLHSASPLFLTGVFLSPSQFSSLWFYPVDTPSDYLSALISSANESIEKNIELFTGLCKKNGIAYKVHNHSEDFILDSVKTESRFADFIVMSSELFYKNIDAQQPNSYTKTVLHEAECPVFLVPELVNGPSRIILAYDGSAASVFAIKQFAYLFPEWCSLDALLVYADAEGKEIPGKEYITELVNRHYSNFTTCHPKTENGEQFAQWVQQQPNSLLISGSFGRAGISSLLKKSFVTQAVQHHKIPVFIAHQ